MFLDDPNVARALIDLIKTATVFLKAIGIVLVPWLITGIFRNIVGK